MRKVKYLVAALLLMGATTTFTSCIDNDEPAGITELRGAKAELIKAKAVVEQARAEYILAQAEYQKALAAHEQANADYVQAKVEYEKLVNDLKAAQNEADKVLYQEQIEAAQQRMEKAALEHQNTMLSLQTTNATLQRNYELVLKQIEIAEAIMSDQQMVSVEFLRNEVAKANAIINGGTYYEYTIKTDKNGLVSYLKGNAVTYWTDSSKDKVCLNTKIYEASEELYKAMLDKSYGYVDSDNDPDTNDKFIPRLQNEVEKYQAEVAIKESQIDKVQNFLEMDVETADWRAEIAELEDSLTILGKSHAELLADVEKAEASTSYMNAAQAYKGIMTGEETDAEGKKVTVTKVGDESSISVNLATGVVTSTVDDVKYTYDELGTAQKLAVAKEKLKTVFGDTDKGKAISIDAFEVEASEPLLKYVNAAKKEALGDKWNETKDKISSFEIAEIDKQKGQFVVKTDGSIASQGQVSANVNTIKAWVKYASDASASANDAAVAELEKEAAEKTLKDAEEAHKEQVAKLAVAIDIKKGNVDKYKTEIEATKADLQTAVKAFNTAYATLKTAVEAYNTTYETIYDNAYATGQDNLKATERVNVYKLKCTFDSQTVVVKTLNEIQTGLGTKWKNDVDVLLKTEANAMVMIADALSGESEENITKAQNKLKTAVDDVINMYYAGSAGKGDLEAAGEKAANDAIAAAKAEDKELGKANEACVNANKALSKAFAALEADKDKSAMAAWSEGELKTVYAHELDGDKAKSLKDITGVEAASTASWIGTDKDDPTKKTILGSDITDEEFTSYTVVKFNKDLADEAYKLTAAATYGDWTNGGENDPQIVAPTTEEMRDKFGAKLATQGGTFGAQIAAQDALDLINEKISAADDLKQLVTDLTKLQSDYNAAIEAAKTKAYGTEIKAYEDAVAANKTAKATFEEEDLKVEDLRLDAKKVALQIEALEAVKTELCNAVYAYLGLEGEAPSIGSYDPAQFEQQLQSVLTALKEQLVGSQDKLARAQAALEMATDGQYDEIAYLQLKVDNLTAELEAAQKAYDEALAKLQTALEIMAKTAE